MKHSLKILIGILILQLYSCQEKVLTTDTEIMQLRDNVEFVFEQTYELYPINDSVRKLSETIDFYESDYWKFNQAGFIIEHGHLITCEDSLYRIERYSKEHPHELEQMIRFFSDIDTVTFYEQTNSTIDTVYKKIYFSDSTLYRSEIQVFDKLGREINYFLEYPPSLKIIKSYYSSGLIKESYYSDNLNRVTKTKYEHNDKGLKTKETYFENDQVIMELNYDYTLDKNNNWITCTEYYNNEPVQIKVRNIKYYKK